MTKSTKISASISEFANVEIILLNFNNADDTIALLGNLEKITYPNFSVLIIDNHSQDNSAEKLAQIQSDFSEWNFIFNDQNIGFSRGCNQGIKLALQKGADFILLLNNDTVVEPDFLDKLVNLSKEHNCLSGGLIYHHNDQSLIWSFGGNITWGALPGHLNLFMQKKTRNDLPAIFRTDWIPGCCLLIPASVIHKIGMLDEDYFAYIEDVDFCIRAKKFGIDCIVTPESVIYHKVGQATGGGYSAQGRRLIAESSVIFIRKHGDLLKQIKFFILFWAGICVAYIREGMKGNSIAVLHKVDGYRSGWKKNIHHIQEIPD